tara:strand:- start:411 stop:656 length:246 start_codon:yes stop_codon:yes gene_type:complete
MKNVKSEIQKMNFAQLNELSAFINDVKVINAKASLTVGQKVNVVQKTKKTPGVITKIMQSKCLVDMLGRVYRVPMSMLEAA